jgi:hypothetical protein
MKATCKMCGALIETPPDPMMDADREVRERRTFFQLIALHIDPKSGRCTPNNKKQIGARMAAVSQDNGWFQRWRLLHEVTDADPAIVEKVEGWREYLNAITTRPIDGEDLPDAAKPESVQ